MLPKHVESVSTWPENQGHSAWLNVGACAHREEQSQTENEKRRREAIEMRGEKNEHMRVTIAQDNDRLLHMLKEAEEARTTIEQVQ